ncbi:alpha-1,2-fucosyltransferase [Bacteroidia bacterium]|nr:alpha-1,2-fucosyltransferase [Bacteroidia bacterium]GHU66823.1 alpha-1,2-fucosyltransferase [Bacteroidia bacterium]
MEIIVFSGGLGNQMFQYAFYLAKKQRSFDVHINLYSIHREGTHNGFELERLFGIKSDNSSWYVRIIRKLLIFKKKKYYKTISNVLLKVVKLTKINIIQEKGDSHYDYDYLIPRDGRVLYFGFWQTSLYFTSLEKEIRSAFSFDRLKLSGQSQSLSAKIQAVESVSVHIRRGDFFDKDFNNAICNKDYYIKSIDLINNKIADAYFVFFSDEPEWVKENIPLSNAIYVDWNQGINSWEDMCLMSKCKHNIIANSTFSWWGAWLNENKAKIVIAPSRFIKKAETPHIYPSDWILLN